MANPVLGPKWRSLQDSLWPGEQHGISSDCPNPYCDYMLTSEDIETAEWSGGSFQCPNCGWKYDITPMMTGEVDRDRTRTGMKLSEMGAIGEAVVKKFAEENQGIPGIGQLVWEAPGYHDPIDLVVGDYAIEVKSLHSESYPRYKIAADPGSGAKRADVIRQKHDRMQELSNHFNKPLYPGMIGVRLNFYTNRADLFFAPEYKDRMMTAMQHVGTTDFANLNPFKRPEDVTNQILPAQGETMGDDSDIPF